MRMVALGGVDLTGDNFRLERKMKVIVDIRKVGLGQEVHLRRLVCV
jgi:hypothetical protein